MKNFRFIDLFCGGGGRLILDMLRRRLETGDAVQRRSTGSVSDDLSRLFPAPGEKMGRVV